VIQIYCGEGKGKTTAAVGLAVRCAGAGGSVLFYQFMKPETSSERVALQQIAGMTVLSGYAIQKFSFAMQEAEKKEAAIGYQKQLSVLAEMLQQQPYDMLILDEIMACLSAGFLQEEMVLSFLQQVPEQTEVVLTGRNPPASLLGKADYISEIRNIRHPYEKHIKARKGIEF
jgi:cob(I)alamin adenosyltransferase